AIISPSRTTGTAINPRCTTHRATPRRFLGFENLGGKRKRVAYWDLLIDVTKEGTQPFDVTCHKLFWNGMQGPLNECAWVYIPEVASCDEADLAVIFGKTKMFMNERPTYWKYKRGERDRKELAKPRVTDTVVDYAHGLLFWHIPKPDLDHVYEI